MRSSTAPSATDTAPPPSAVALATFTVPELIVTPPLKYPAAIVLLSVSVPVPFLVMYVDEPEKLEAIEVLCEPSTISA